ncbi:pyridoxamine 5'-phosphate oxidase-domain-containing protein [Mycena maculata]|uniref:Pyridoxamine 5'-phosphate oxidase-domain-containing protein n=1 Tax=Mycena maculata TaxID=230809 RepID=A0AAD7IG14_9AGAR|nr:pyridoxamine 5'-phosphate oxidase-domain-containing protein [Mycena maculata]
MRLILALAATAIVGPASASLIPQSQYAFQNNRIPTVHESAVMARRILHLSALGTLSTVFPAADAPSSRPADVAGTSIGLIEYIADCEPTGDPTLLALDIATTFKNAAAGSNASLSLSWTPPPGSRPVSPASLPRFALTGYLEPLRTDEVAAHGIPACFARAHPDARAWFPGNRIHASRWARLVVREVYWVGGFGDRAYIGWIPSEEWRSVTREEVRECVLPGEKEREGWREWLGF